MSEQKGKFKTDKQSTFVPNSFQTPNGYVDDIMPFLTGQEYKVLIYAVRRILGFQKRQDRISISQFTDGTQNKDGKTLDLGTGLGIDTVRKCLASLVDFGIMVRIEENDPRTNEGALWGLQWNEDDVNWQALYERAENMKKANLERIQKARSVRQGGTCGTELSPSGGTEPGGSCGTETQKTESETQGKKENIDIQAEKQMELIIEALKPCAIQLWAKTPRTWWDLEEKIRNAKTTIQDGVLTIAGLGMEAAWLEDRLAQTFNNFLTVNNVGGFTSLTFQE